MTRTRVKPRADKTGQGANQTAKRVLIRKGVVGALINLTIPTYDRFSNWAVSSSSDYFWGSSLAWVTLLFAVWIAPLTDRAAARIG
jgi:hypothetical protein